MKQSMEKYAKKIGEGKINPVVDVNKMGSGMIFDPSDENTPVDVVGLGIYKLNGEKYTEKTGDREYVFVPMEGRFTLKTEGEVYELERDGGPFNVKIGESNVSAVYIPRDSYYEIEGHGEIIYYTAPSSKKMKPVYIKKGETPNISRGSFYWRRNVTTFVEPGISTNLIVGETYSPPALWTGTPVHVHDDYNPAGGESNHEEIYYHFSRLDGREMPNYAVQLLFDGKDMNKAYLCPNKTAVAIPGGCHPVVASPVSDSAFGWALAGDEGPLMMREIKDFSYQGKIGGFVDKIREKYGDGLYLTVPRSCLDSFAADNDIDDFQKTITELILNELGIRFED